MRAFNLSLRNSSQDDFLDMRSVNQAIALGTNHWINTPMVNTFIHPIIGKEMQYMDLMKDPTLDPLWKRCFGNELGHLFQGIRDIKGTNNCFFVDLAKIPKDHQITYKKLSVIINLTKRKKNGSYSQ
jgi:hypothetical protein